MNLPTPSAFGLRPRVLSPAHPIRRLPPMPLANLLLLFPLVPLPRASAQERHELSVSDLGREIDASLHWLRSQFDLDTGSFGSLEDDALVLLAFAESPRRYRSSDGPFVARPLAGLLKAQSPDGSYGSYRRTLLVFNALQALDERTTRTALERMRPHLDHLPLPQSFAQTKKAALVAEAGMLLAAKGDGVSWGTGDQRVGATARNVHRLSLIHAELRGAAERKKPEQPTPLPALSKVDRGRIRKAIVRGTEFLFAEANDGKWGFDGRADPGITAMVCAALATHPGLSPEHNKTLEQALDWLVSLQKPDGSIHAGSLANYVTSVAIMALSRPQRPADRVVVERARAFLVALQSDEGEGYGKDDPYYGGVGYGGDERPDLSNLQIALEALAESGSRPGDETFRKALRFLQRCQNHSETNDLVLERDGVSYASGNDGGAGYAPGESKAGFIELKDGRRVVRSYGSMTYALLKGYLFAGLPKEDPRVEAAWSWLRENYTLDVNPGFHAASDPTAAYQGLFYYFFTMAKALALYGEEHIVDGGGQSHAWRTELAGRLLSMQRQDGSWINSNAARWYEGNPVLATAYAMLTLGATL